jgi:hypothetical protein
MPFGWSGECCCPSFPGLLIRTSASHLRLNPFVQPIAKALRVPARLIALIALSIVAALFVALARLPQLAG